MAAAPTPPPVSVNLTALDPLSADMTAICGAITAICNFLITPAGQKFVQAEIELGGNLESAVSKVFAAAWNGITGLFKKK